MGRVTEYAGPELARLYESQLTRWAAQVQTYRESVRLYQEALRLMTKRRPATTACSPQGAPEFQPLATDDTDCFGAAPAVRPQSTSVLAAPFAAPPGLVAAGGLLPAGTPSSESSSIPPNGSSNGSSNGLSNASSDGSSNGELALSMSHPSPLTPRQREIAALIARGYTNYQIARELVLTPGTVANHVRHILQKLGFQCRAQIAVWATRHDLVPLGPH